MQPVHGAKHPARRSSLEHDQEKCGAVFRKDHAQNKELKRDDDSTQSHRAKRSTGELKIQG
jgi:hypothetical protein